MKRLASLVAGLCGCTAMPLHAQQAAPAPADAAQRNEQAADEEYNTIVVNGGRPEGSVIGSYTPEVTLSPGDVRSFGVSTLSDLISELSPQTTSGQGRGGEAPVVLLGGKRISGFAEIRDIPTEAIQRVEILPEEVALRYGYRPDQKVVNVVLRRRFNAYTGELEAAAPTEGGQFSPGANASYLRIRDGRRLNVALDYQRSSPLYESERDIVAQSPRLPFDLTGNIASVSGGPIDPTLTALLGRAATVVGVPAIAATRATILGDYVPGTVNPGDIGAYRTLLPATETASANVVYARSIFKAVSASLNGTFSYSDSRAAQGAAAGRFGLPAGNPFSPFATDTVLFRYLGEFGPLAQRSRDLTGHLGLTLNGRVGGWQWTFTGSYDHVASRTATVTGYDLTAYQTRLDGSDDTVNPFARLMLGDTGGRLVDRARSISDLADARLVTNGPLFDLPAGAVTASLTLGGTLNDFRSRAIRSGIESAADLSRDIGTAQASIDMPIASRRNDVLAALGDLSVNVNAGYNRLSDFGGLRTFGAGVNWTPIRPVTLIASLTTDEGAPTVQQLGNPQVTTVGVRTFDYVRGETVDITRLAGGNPFLTADERRVLKLGATVRPLADKDLSFTANYTASRIRDPIATFPAATAAIEAAFPDRFVRDATGRLTRIDARPINFDRQESSEIRYGINFSKQLSTPPRATAPPGGDTPNLRDLDRPAAGERPPPDPNAPPPPPPGGPRADGPRPDGPPGGRRGPGGFGGFGGPRGPGGRGTRLQAAIYHTIHLKERISIFSGGPALDLLNGDAIGAAGGQPRHEVQAQLGLTRNGLGARLSGNWQSATTVNGDTSAQTLLFSSLTTLNLRLFANLGQQQALARRVPFLRGSRISLSVTNLFNQRQDVRGADGSVPVRFQPDYLDPLGRSVRVSFRKLFF